MKKSDLLRRMLSLLLVLAMVMPMVSMGVSAAVGDVSDAGMSLPSGATGVSNTDTVSWPVKIYDYLNDGMLFEYAQANDLTATTNLYYGGGMPMPFTDSTIGNDYTVSWTYDKKAWDTWVSADATDRETGAEVDGTVVQAVDDTAPMYAHFKYIKTTPDQDSDGNPVNDPNKDLGSKYRAWISDFKAEDGNNYDKDDVRYIVIVYRTNAVTDNASINFTYRYDTSSGTSDYTGSDKTLRASTEWTYFVYDMFEDSSTWSAIGDDNIHYVRFMFPLNGIANGVAEEMDISHIAYFSSAEEAENFGEKALVFNNDPGRYLVDGGTAKPNTASGYVYDYTSSDAYESALYGSSQALGNNSWIGSTQVAAANGNPMYLKVSEGSDDLDKAYIANFSSDFGGAKSKSDIRYVTIVYRSSGIGTGERSYGFWIESGYSPYAAGKGSRSYSYMKTLTPSSSWTYLTYDLSLIKDIDYGSISTVTKVGWYLPGLYSDEKLDISHIGFFGSQSEADTFGKAAVAYDKNPGTTKTWNMGNNASFAMLYASAGGAWNQTSAKGAKANANYPSNSYDTYAIGKLHEGSKWSNIYDAMVSFHNDGVNNADTKIHLLYPVDGTEYCDMSTFDFDGYKLFGSVIQNGMTLFTAGLVEPTLETVTYEDNTSERRIVYREETVDYIADLLSKTLIIPRFDANGNPNYNYVRGTAHSQFGTVNGEPIDLATALRNCLGITFTEGQNKGSAPTRGTYAETEAKKSGLIGSFASCKDNIKTCYDAAYYLLNNLFVRDSYNEKQDDYTYLQLNKVEGTESTYVFDAGFTKEDESSALNYGSDYILNMTDAAYKHEFVFEVSSTGYENRTTLHPFLPATDPNNNSQYPSTTYSPYFADDGVTSVTDGKATYADRNFNYVMATNGQFQYYSEDELFFQFEGDDDVYLFLNGQLVLDIGAAHQISVVQLDVNDYVDWAWSIKNDAAAYAKLTESEKARVDALALNDGDVCSFDFYYMERHGFGANCRIMTNIRVTDPAMDVTKSAYQDGVQVSEGGIISKEKPVEYGFAMENKGDSALYRLVFKDADIGINLSWDKGLEITGTNVCDANGGTLDATDLTALITHPDYEDISITFADNEALKKFLHDGTAPGMQSGGGLYVGSTILIRGFAYKLTEADKNAGKFFNTVKAEANSQPDGTGKPLMSEDDMRVFIAAEPMYYQWAGEDHEITVAWEKLIDDIHEAANTEGNSLAGQGLDEITLDNVTAIAEVNAAGSVRDYEHVSVDSANKRITIKYPTPGSYVFYLKITYSGKNATIPVLVNVADVTDSIFVLDYGLNAELTKDGELHKGDTLTVPARASSHSLLGIGENTPSYGSNTISFIKDDDNAIGDETKDNTKTGYDGMFTLNSNVLSYRPNDFMNQRDKIWLALSVHEDGFESILGSTDINNEAQMYKSVTVLPANVVYYEDDFPAITYTKILDDGAADIEATFTRIEGAGSDDLDQDMDQDQEYGQDSNYQSNSNHDKSGNSIHKITIKDSNTFASFNFTGTGFELVGSTTAANPASLAVTVTDVNGNLVKRIPVITEYDNGDNGGEEAIYQVPVIRVDDLTYGTYTVNINGVPTYERTFDADGSVELTMVTSYFYLDGLRIFEPLETDGNAGAAPEYREEESDVQFVEIREEILNGKVATASVESGETAADKVVTINSALTTWTENHHGDSYTEDGKLIDTSYQGNAVSSVQDYLIKGPNNEVYMNGDLAETAMIFYVKQSEDVSGKADLQIAVSAIDAAKFYIGASGDFSAGFEAQVKYGAFDKTTQTFSWKALATVTSATEQYYTIPLDECYDTGDGIYQVAVFVDSGMASFTSLKLNGLELQTIADPEASEETINSTVLYYKDTVLYHAGADGTIGNDDDVMASEYVVPNLTAVGYQMRGETLASAGDEEVEDTTPTEPEETTPSEPEDTTPTEPEETEPTTPETKPSKPGTGVNKPGFNKPTHNPNVDRLYNLWKTLRESIEFLLKLTGRR